MIRLTGDGTVNGTKIFITGYGSDGTMDEFEVTEHVKSVYWAHTGGQEPTVVLGLAGHLTGVDLHGNEPLVDMEGFKRLKKILADEQQPHRKRPEPEDEHVHPLAGLERWI